MSRVTLLPALLVAAALGVAACGGDDDGDTAARTEATQTVLGPETQTAIETLETGERGREVEVLKISADPTGELAFEQKRLVAHAEEIRIDFENPAPVGHDLVVENEKGKEIARTDVISEGETSLTFHVDQPQTYTFYCSVPGHREGGMVGKLTILGLP